MFWGEKNMSKHPQVDVSAGIFTRGLVEALPVHSELGGNPVEAQRHERHVCDALIGAWRWPLLYRSLQEAKVHLQGAEDETKQKEYTTQSNWTEPRCAVKYSCLKINSYYEH